MFGCPAVLVADDDAREVHRQKPAAADEVGKGKHQQPARNNHQRIQPLRQIQTAYQLGQYLAAEPAQQQAEAELQHQHPQERQYARPLRLHNQANQRRNQKNRHRVVGAISNVACTRSFRRTPLLRSRLNTAPASVEPTIAAIRMPNFQSDPR